MNTQEKVNQLRTFIQANLIGILASLLIFSSIANVAFYNKLKSLKNSPQQAVQEQNENLIKKVSKLINLPADEQPTIATVSDPEVLKSQPFFAKAEKGFKVLIYADAGKSILYDPFENKIIEVASINPNRETTTPLPIQTPKSSTLKKK